jgi:hypothetical protein
MFLGQNLMPESFKCNVKKALKLAYEHLQFQKLFRGLLPDTHFRPFVYRMRWEGQE